MTNSQPMIMPPPTPTKAAGYVDLYCNATRVGIGSFDFSLVVSRNVEGPNGQPGIEDLAVIRFSPQHFKSVVASLQQSLAAWENAFGPITNTVEDQSGAIFEAASAALKAGLGQAGS